MAAKALYICYFGVRQPLVQTQVIPYLRELVKGGHDITLLTFEPKIVGGTDDSLPPRPSATPPNQGGEFLEEGIDWHWLTYHKRPSAIATAYDVFRGAWYVRKLMRVEKFDVLHVRAHIPGPMAVLARKYSRSKPKILFDIRGFIPEEYTDAGIWPKDGWLYRAVKRVERWLMKEADGFVVLTEKARDILFPESKETGFDKLGRPVEVIPCCVDLKWFAAVNGTSRSEMRKKLGVEDRRVIAYVGSFGGWYLTEEMMGFFAVARELDPRTFALIMTQRDKAKVVENIRAKGFGDEEYLVESVSPREIAGFLNASDAAVSFIKACYSKQSSSPTKIPEYLACGLPIVSNRGVGDVDELIEGNGVGVLIDDFSRESYLKALKDIEALGDVSEKCRETALRYFDLEKVGGQKYRRLYRKLLADREDVT